MDNELSWKMSVNIKTKNETLKKKKKWEKEKKSRTLLINKQNELFDQPNTKVDT